VSRPSLHLYKRRRIGRGSAPFVPLIRREYPARGLLTRSKQTCVGAAGSSSRKNQGPPLFDAFLRGFMFMGLNSVE